MKLRKDLKEKFLRYEINKEKQITMMKQQSLIPFKMKRKNGLTKKKLS